MRAQNRSISIVIPNQWRHFLAFSLLKIMSIVVISAWVRTEACPFIWNYQCTQNINLYLFVLWKNMSSRSSWDKLTINSYCILSYCFYKLTINWCGTNLPFSRTFVLFDIPNKSVWLIKNYLFEMIVIIVHFNILQQLWRISFLPFIQFSINIDIPANIVKKCLISLCTNIDQLYRSIPTENSSHHYLIHLVLTI